MLRKTWLFLRKFLQLHHVLLHILNRLNRVFLVLHLLHIKSLLIKNFPQLRYVQISNFLKQRIVIVHTKCSMCSTRIVSSQSRTRTIRIEVVIEQIRRIFRFRILFLTTRRTSISILFVVTYNLRRH